MRSILGAVALLGCMPPSWSANAILHPSRRAVGAPPDVPHEAVTYEVNGVTIRGWLFRATPPRRGLMVWLHGVGDNRGSGEGLARRFGPKGYDVLSYDSRACGESGGDAVTYGFYEKRDLAAVLDRIGADGVVVFGSSMGAAVALQAAEFDPRVRAVVAQSPFADLRTIIRERALFFTTDRQVDRAIAIAERKANFTVNHVSPEVSAPRIRAPVLLIHGEDDDEIDPAHSRRIHGALAGPKKLLIVEDAGHNDVLAREDVWRAIEEWMGAL